jgi:transcriptional regulator with XRE-family HTH domain
MELNEIGERIRTLREQRGFSQDNLASALGITQPSYARLEKDDMRLNIPRLIQIAKFLKVSVTELVNEQPNRIINNTQNTYGYVEIMNADKEHIESLKEEIETLKNIISGLMKK